MKSCNIFLQRKRNGENMGKKVNSPETVWLSFEAKNIDLTAELDLMTNIWFRQKLKNATNI